MLITLYLIHRRRRNRQRLYHRRILRSLRDNSNPFELSPGIFVKYYRLTKEATQELIRIIKPFGNTKSISFELAVLGTLSFLATGSYQKPTGHDFHYGVSQSTVSRNNKQIIKLIVEHILPLQIRFPQTDEEFTALKNGFQARYNCLMPEVWGVIDGSLIAIHSPPVFSELYPARLYRCRKGYTAINALFITDSEMRILYVNARFPGSCHDSAIFKTSLARLKLVNEFLRTGRMRGILLGDQGFGLEPWIYPPFPGPRNRQEREFNKAHKEVRMGVENVIGELKTVFRALLKDRVLHYDPTASSNIIYAAAALHNFRINHNVQAAHLYDGYDGPPEPPFPDRDPDRDSEEDESEEEVEEESDEEQNLNIRRRPRDLGALFSVEGKRSVTSYLRNYFAHAE